MEEFERLSKNELFRFPIEKRIGPNNNEVSFSPQRGGIITSLKLKGEEVLYFDLNTFNDSEVNVKGGIPILFPNAGPLKEGPFLLRQHGFARNSENWIVKDSPANEFIEELSSDEATKEVYPFNFLSRTKAILEEDGSMTLLRETTNLEHDKDMPVSEGLHPYFPVPDNEKKNIRFDFPGGEVVENSFSSWSQGQTAKIDNPKLKDPSVVLRVMIPKLGTLALDVSQEYKRIWVWTQPGKNFICIEPVMRDAGGLINDPELIKPQHTFSTKINIRRVD
ncbi:MAG: hypothetical protein WC575_02205 [Patescibacteria group bacterium]